VPDRRRAQSAAGNGAFSCAGRGADEPSCQRATICQPIGTHRRQFTRIVTGPERARALLHAFGMTLFSRSIDRVADIVGRVFGRLAAVIVGFTMMMLGLGMTATIVLLPAGVVVGLLGVAIFVGGLARPRDGTAG